MGWHSHGPAELFCHLWLRCFFPEVYSGIYVWIVRGGAQAIIAHCIERMKVHDDTTVEVHDDTTVEAKSFAQMNPPVRGLFTTFDPHSTECCGYIQERQIQGSRSLIASCTSRVIVGVGARALFFVSECTHKFVRIRVFARLCCSRAIRTKLMFSSLPTLHVSNQFTIKRFIRRSSCQVKHAAQLVRKEKGFNILKV